MLWFCLGVLFGGMVGVVTMCIFQINNRYIVGTFHPAALLRDPGKKEEAFKDFLRINNFVATLHTS